MYYNALDIYFAQAMMRLCSAPNQKAEALGTSLCRLLSYQIRNAHVCLDLGNLPPLDLWPRGDQQKFPETVFIEPQEECSLLLEKNCQEWLSSASIVTDKPEQKVCPLVWKKNRVYLYRYYVYERETAQALLRLLKKDWDLPEAEAPKAKTYFEELFLNKEQGLDYQKLSAVMALGRHFFIISGGPGTGKTSTIIRFLAVFQKLYPNKRAVLTAPTGKAAMRLQQAAAQQREKIREAANKKKSGIDKQFLVEVSTLQRLLGQSRDGLKYYHNEKNPLDIDLLIIDESSMLNLSLFAHTLRALGPETRCILLGDHHQLTSVESGAVLGELCRFPMSLSRSFAKKIETLAGFPLDALVVEKTNQEANPLTNSIAVLEKNFRFGEKSGIGIVSGYMRQGKIEAALSCLQSNAYPDLNYQEGNMYSPAFQEIIIEEYRNFFSSSSPHEILRKLSNFCVMAPFRQGRHGVDALNTCISQLLSDTGIIDLHQENRGKHGNHERLCFFPILISENDYSLSLFNGDFGLAYQEKKSSAFIASFLDYTNAVQEEKYRTFPLGSLPFYEKAFAATVHKSQGSEFEHVLLLLPEEPHPLLTKELVYTALTRARKKISLFAYRNVLESALTHSEKRTWGLLE